MAVHSFESIGEIRQAADGKEKESKAEQVLRETRDFDNAIRQALAHDSYADRRTALLQLESLRDFKRSHPTVEVGTRCAGL